MNFTPEDINRRVFMKKIALYFLCFVMISSFCVAFSSCGENDNNDKDTEIVSNVKTTENTTGSTYEVKGGTDPYLEDIF